MLVVSWFGSYGVYRLILSLVCGHVGMYYLTLPRLPAEGGSVCEIPRPEAYTRFSGAVG